MRFIKNEEGQGMVEYGIIIAMVSIVAVSSLVALSTGLSEKYDTFAGVLSVEELEDGTYMITTEDGVYILTNLGRLQGPYTGSETDIQIPGTLNGFNLKEISQDVFKSAGLTQVLFDAGTQLLRIHARAFQDNELSSIALPNSLTRIDLWAFKDNNLTEITIPPNVHTIEQRAFDGNNITRVTIGANVSKFGNNVFANDSAGFKTAYTAGGAGTYVYSNGNWEKQ